MSATAHKEFTLVRTFDAPRELVFQCWTDPAICMQWWGPATFTAPHCSIDFRVGGAWHFCMRSPDGQDFWYKGIYQQIVPPERLVSKTFFSDAEGNVVEPSAFGFSPEWPTETLFDVTFEDVGGKTKLTLRQFGITPEVAKTVRAEEGWSSSFDKLDAVLANLAG